MAVPKEGPRAPLFYAALFLLGSGPAQAQTVDVSDLETCAGLASAAEKLACFEAIIAAEDDVGEAIAGDEAVVEESTPVEEPASVEASGPGTGDAGVVAPVVATEAGAAGQTGTEDPQPAPSEDFGREHIEREPPPEALAATVVDVTRTGYGLLVFHLDNGQVWRQIEKRYYPYPKGQEFDVTISAGILGEYQLQVGGAGRKVTVRRVK